MNVHSLRINTSREALPKTHQLAWKLAAVAADVAPIENDVTDTVINRLIDNAAIAMSAINQRAVANARSQAVAHPNALHPRSYGARIFGLPNTRRLSVEWAAYANAVAINEFDFSDAFTAVDTAHPSSAIPAVLAVAQHCNRSGADLLRGIVTAYELNIALAKSLNLHSHGLHHATHLGAAIVGGIGACLALDEDIIYQAIEQTLNTSLLIQHANTIDQNSWTACAVGHVNKLAIEAIDRSMRGETIAASSYESENGLLSFIGGKQALHHIELPGAGDAKHAILGSYAREYAADHRAQAFIDLAFQLRAQIEAETTDTIEEIILHTDGITDRAIGTGTDDPRRYDPSASRSTLAHSLTYIFAVALQDGRWHHTESYAPERVQRADTVQLWRRIRTVESNQINRRGQSLGGRAEIRFKNGRTIKGELSFAHAHPLGAKPFGRADMLRKFEALTTGIVSAEEQQRFLNAVQRLPNLSAGELAELNITADMIDLIFTEPDGRGVF